MEPELNAEVDLRGRLVCKTCKSNEVLLVDSQCVDCCREERYIAKSSFPPLPAGWHGPWEADQDGNLWGMRHGRLCDFAIDCGFKNAQFLAALLNVTHPSQTKGGE